ncbi:flagellar M-ring protein FliF [Gemmatimonadetes bacterium T265]|nr:flagellar M-ring protein FliF [Gemmatimonadetes bacterium T265]
MSLRVLAALPAPLAPLQPAVDRLGGPRRALILLVGLLTAGLVFGVSRWATAPTFVPVFANVPVEQSGKMTDKLGEAGIEYHLEKGGTEIQVKTEDLARARVTLARDGGLPNAGRPGLELFDQPSWGMTDFTQRINYRRALEGELERTIGKMRGIEQAQVHVAMPETQLFRRGDRPLEASVVLKLTNGERPSADVVEGMTHLVAASVDGLASDHVTIVDDAGRMLTMDGEAGSMAGLTSRQLAVQREVEGYLEKKAQEIVAQVVGPKNARVQVSALVNFDKVERTTEAVDPDKQAVATEQKAEITPGAQGGAASTNVATSYETTKSTETFSGAIGNVRRLTVAVLVNDKLSTGAKPAPVPRSPAELARLDTLVRNAVGLDSARGDKLSVVNVAFDGGLTPAAEPKADVWQKLSGAEKPLVTGLALAALLVVAVVTMRALKPAAAPAAEAAVAALGAGTAGSAAVDVDGEEIAPVGTPALGSGEGGQLAVSESGGGVLVAGPDGTSTVLRELSNPVRDQVVAMIEQRPEAATRVVRAWLRQD